MTIFINNPPTVATCHIWHEIAGHGSDSFNNESQPWPGLATVSTVEKLMTSQNQFLGLTTNPYRGNGYQDRPWLAKRVTFWLPWPNQC